MPINIAIVGAGPSGFYVIDALQKLDIDTNIFLFEKLPTPYGLLRGGVAPDHLKMKNLDKYFERIATKHDNVHFIGNCSIGEDVSINTLSELFSAVFITTGAIKSKSMGIPGEELKNVHHAADFVGWYNGHPDFVGQTFDLSGKSAAVIGVGNVALDIARILAKTPQELQQSDCPNPMIEALAKSNIKHIHIIGRRGPLQAKFTPNELGEFEELEEASVHVTAHDMHMEPEVIKHVNSAAHLNKTKKNLDILQHYLKLEGGKTKTIHFHFHRSPIAFKEGRNSTVTAIECKKNIMTGPAESQTLQTTNETEIIDADIIFTSIGYKGSKIPGLPFSEDGTIPNSLGRINASHEKSSSNDEKNSQKNEKNSPKAALYTAGWIKRGPTGVIGTNKHCAIETVSSFSQDLEHGKIPQSHMSSEQILTALKTQLNKQLVSFEDWKIIDNSEVTTGQKLGKPREKFIHIPDMLNVLNNPG